MNKVPAGSDQVIALDAPFIGRKHVRGPTGEGVDGVYNLAVARISCPNEDVSPFGCGPYKRDRRDDEFGGKS